MESQLTKNNQEILDTHKDDFYLLTEYGTFFLYQDGYSAVGILKSPIPHGDTSNNILIESVGSTNKSKRITQLFSVAYTIPEARALLACLQKALEMYDQKQINPKLNPGLICLN